MIVDMWDDDTRYAVIRGRDARYDGQFFTGVMTTGIYCRPSCPARTPARSNVTFFRTAAAAQSAGFRACRRCRPEAAPGSPDWDVAGDIASRAIRLIDDGVVEREGVEGLSTRLGYSRRQLQRILVDEVGAAPLALAAAHRLHTARALLEHSRMPIADVALAAGFGSIRQFNDAARAAWALTPTQVRASAAALRSGERIVPDGAAPTTPGAVSVTLRLRVREPFDGTRVLAFLAARAVDGVERVEPQAHTRSLALHHGPALIRLEPKADAVVAALHLTDPRDLGAAVARCRALLDLDADPVAVSEALSRDPGLAPVVRSAAGLRVPGSVAPFEAILRAVVGQQVSVRGASRTLGEIARRHGETWRDNVEDPGSPGQSSSDPVWRIMPTPQSLADVDPAQGLIPAARWEALRAVSRAVLDGGLDVSAGAERASVRERLARIPGIGPWTVDYVMLRGYGDPDAFPAGDLVLRQAMGLAAVGLAARAEAWRPWRAYAAQHLWTAQTEGRGGPHDQQ